MKDEKPMEELVKIVIDFRVFMNNLADELAKALADIKAPVEEEDTWEMKCPYEYGDKHYCIQSSGDVFLDSWRDIEADYSFFSQGNIFKTKQAAELEAKRRNLLTRFRAFRNECNGDWEPDWESNNDRKHYICFHRKGNWKLIQLEYVTTFNYSDFSKIKKTPNVQSTYLVMKSKNCLWRCKDEFTRKRTD